jgi:hypothetical protein
VKEWIVWTGGRTSGLFPSQQAALKHCRVVANDHRTKFEWVTLGVSAFRYVGPRGRRHGTRLVAYIGTRAGLDLLNLDVDAILMQLGETT